MVHGVHGYLYNDYSQWIQPIFGMQTNFRILFGNFATGVIGTKYFVTTVYNTLKHTTKYTLFVGMFNSNGRYYGIGLIYPTNEGEYMELDSNIYHYRYQDGKAYAYDYQTKSYIEITS